MVKPIDISKEDVPKVVKKDPGKKTFTMIDDRMRRAMALVLSKIFNISPKTNKGSYINPAHWYNHKSRTFKKIRRAQTNGGK